MLVPELGFRAPVRGRAGAARIVFAVLLLIVTPGLQGVPSRTLAASTFTDIADHPFAREIAWIADAGITSGCSATRFCPDARVSREQMASFLVRAVKSPPASQDYFSDDNQSTHQASINRLREAGLTTGCAPNRFCPRASVSRAEMAAFMTRAFGLEATNDDYYVDDETSSHEASINRLSAGGISRGCDTARYCPGGVITRGQMAAFLFRAMGPRLASPPALGFPAWGMMGGYSAAQLADMSRRGISVVMMTISWPKAEPADNSFDEDYFARKRAELAGYRSAGYDVVLSYGLEHAPPWLITKPNARYVNQHGHRYSASDEPNLVFATELRPYAEDYTAQVFEELGRDFFAVRIGGGHWGELTYPQIRRADGHVENLYWAFDPAADRARPTGSWRPGQPSPSGEARRFLEWYLQSLTDFQNWQIDTLRDHYPGTIAPLYASWGMRAGDFEKAVATNLSGTSPAERNGEVVGGFDHARHIGAIDDANVAVWGTYGERPGTVSWLAELAAAKGFDVMAENSGHDSLAQMDQAVVEARRHSVRLFMWVRAETAYCRCSGYATIENYEGRISSR